MLNGDRPPPIAKGTLEQRPLAHLLIYARERHLRGTMELGSTNAGASLVFADGMLSKIATSQKNVATPAQLSSFVRSLFALPLSTSFAFYDKFDALPDAASSSIDPLSLVWHPVRDALSSKQVDAVVDRTADVPLLVPASADTDIFGFDAEENRVIARMRDRATRLGDLEKISPRAKRIVYLLLVTKKVEAGTARPKLDSISDHVDTSSPPPSSARNSSAPRTNTPPRISFAPGESIPPSFGENTRKRIRDRAAGIDKEDFFAMLGVPRDATSDAVRAAFFSLAKQWHPDRIPSVLGDVKEACARVFSHMNDAYQTLIDSERRAKYLELISSVGTSAKTAEQETIVRVVEAAQLFQKAEVLFKRNDLAGAEALVRRANELDPRQAEYLALIAWIDATKPGNTSAAQTLGYIETLSQAIARNENCERAYFYRAMLYKRLGNRAAAMRDFRAVVEQNPRNVDAQRELRLHNMRGGKTSSRPSKAPSRYDSQSGNDGRREKEKEDSRGLFGGFFNKKK